MTYKNMDGAFGGFIDYPSNVPDTAQALQALAAAGSTDATAINGAVSYLLAAQNADGGWGFIPGKPSGVYYTAVVMQALETQPQTTAIANALSQATTFLLAHQNADGGFGGSPSTVWETSLAFLAISKTTGDVTARTSAINYLLATQQADGSWNQDPYQTALALQALHASLNQTPPPPPPTTGTLTGTVKDGSTQAPLQGVLVEVQAQGLSTMTDASGAFSLTNVTAGSVSLTFAKTGYQTGGLTTTLDAGSVKDLGTLYMTANPNTGIITGMVTDAQTGNALDAVAIGITGPSNLNTTTAADGTYTIPDVPIGSYTLTASMTGYDPVTAAGDVIAGGTLLFSPALYPEGTSPGGTTGTITGTVVDAETSAPIPTATVTLIETGLSAGTDPSGQFWITDVPQGTHSLSISAPNYATQMGTVVLSGGSTADLGLIHLSAAPSTSTVSGVVSDAQSGLPLSGATVSLLETGAVTTTGADGSYAFSGIELLNFTLKAAAAGYAGQVITVTLSQPGAVTLNFALSTAQIGLLQITSLTTDQAQYPALTNVQMHAAVQWSGAESIEAQAVFLIKDPQGIVVATPAVALGVLVLDPDTGTGTDAVWNTGVFSPGSYRAVLQVTDADGTVLAEREAPFTIEPTVGLANSAVAPRPGFSHVGATETLQVNLLLVNGSNTTTTLTLVHELKSPSGSVIHQGTTTLSLGPDVSDTSVNLATFEHTFLESGEYPIRVEIHEGATLLAALQSVIGVAPEERIEPSMALTPQTIPPGADQRIRIEIRLEGMEAPP
jgi:hypothetical protein